MSVHTSLAAETHLADGQSLQVVVMMMMMMMMMMIIIIIITAFKSQFSFVIECCCQTLIFTSRDLGVPWNDIWEKQL
jgi:hypothetical protein